MFNPARTVVCVLVVSLLSACASGGTERTSTPMRSREVLTREQIAGTRASNAYDAVQRLRSNWMRLRGSTQMPAQAGGGQFTQNPVLVYLDDQKLGTIDTLQNIEIAAVQYIRYFSPADASARWGFNHGGGVIFVSTRALDQ